jgi:hypothetical protein
MGDKRTLGRTVLEINLDLGLAHQIINGQKRCWTSEHPVIRGRPNVRRSRTLQQHDFPQRRSGSAPGPTRIQCGKCSNQSIAESPSTEKLKGHPMHPIRLDRPLPSVIVYSKGTQNRSTTAQGIPW